MVLVSTVECMRTLIAVASGRRERSRYILLLASKQRYFSKATASVRNYLVRNQLQLTVGHGAMLVHDTEPPDLDVIQVHKGSFWHGNEDQMKHVFSTGHVRNV